MEILSPAGSLPALRAAVFAGANAVYFGGNEFNARQNASNFSDEEISEAVSFCHERGVKCFAAVNTLIRDREFPEAEGLVRKFSAAGIDAFIVQDPALASYLIKNSDIPVHASTQMTVHSLAGALELYEAGFKRIVLSRELSKDDIFHIVKGLPDGAETEVFVHGALCMCYSGQCYMSSVIGKRSGNRGLCAQPCRLPYRGGYKLSLKDLSLLRYVSELEKAGVTSLKIEGRMKSPEYVYAVTEAYAAAAAGEPFSKEKEEYLSSVFSRGGFTDGYFADKPGKEMFGRKENPSVKISFEEKEPKKFGLDIKILPKDENTAEIRFVSSDGYSAETEIKYEQAKANPTDALQAEKQLFRLGNTVYYEKSFSYTLPDGIFISASELNRARRTCVESLSRQRVLRLNSIGNVPFSSVKKPPFKSEKTRLRGYFLNPKELPENANLLEKIWLPLTCAELPSAQKAIENYGNRVGFFLPRIFHDSEKCAVEKFLCAACDSGISDFLCGNIGQIRFLKDFALAKGVDLKIHGDFGLNIYNSATSEIFFEKGLESEVLSFEAPFAALKNFSDGKTGIIAYGRLPFMIMRNCVKNKHNMPETLTDRRGKDFLLTCDFSCRNSLWNADRLWLADKDLSSFGFLQLLFTDEKKDAAEIVINAYIEGLPPFDDNITRGLYF